MPDLTTLLPVKTNMHISRGSTSKVAIIIGEIWQFSALHINEQLSTMNKFKWRL